MEKERTPLESPAADHPKTKEEALASFRATAARLSDPKEQESIEAEARQQVIEELEAFNELLRRSQGFGADEWLRCG